MTGSRKKPATKSQKAFMLLVKQLPCVVDNEDWYDGLIAKGWTFIPSGRIVSEAHHITNGYRLGHEFILPLSVENHRGKRGFSGIERDYWDKSLANQLRLMGKVYQVLGLEPPVYQSKIVRKRI
jgi:hypothetical protein